MACPLAALVLPGIVSFLPLCIKSRKKVLRCLLRHTEVQVFARIGWGVSRAQWILSPYDSPFSSAPGLPASLWLPSLRMHSWSTHCLLRGRLPPAHPGYCPLEMAAAWECGWGPLGQRLLDRSLSVELPGSFPWPRPMTGRLRMLPIIQFTEHKGATPGLSGPDARDGSTGSPPPRARTCPESTGQLSHAGMRTISSGPTGDKDTEKQPGGSSPQARADHPS